MIHGQIGGLHNVLARLEKSEFEFYPTGSRAVSLTPPADADYDFFATASSQIAKFLDKNGFKPLIEDAPFYPSSGDPEQELHAIYRHLHYPVDVQLVENAERKADIQETIRPVLEELYREDIPSDVRKLCVKYVWKAAFRTHREEKPLLGFWKKS